MLSSFLAPTTSGSSLDESPSTAAFPAGFLPDTRANSTALPDPPTTPRRCHCQGFHRATHRPRRCRSRRSSAQERAALLRRRHRLGGD